MEVKISFYKGKNDKVGIIWNKNNFEECSDYLLENHINLSDDATIIHNLILKLNTNNDGEV